jgi:hypothetical protein
MRGRMRSFGSWIPLVLKCRQQSGHSAGRLPAWPRSCSRTHLRREGLVASLRQLSQLHRERSSYTPLTILLDP